MSNLLKKQEDSEAPSLKVKFKSKLKSLKPFSAMAKGAIVPLVCVCLFFGLGFFAVARNYQGSIYIQVMNALTLSIYNPEQQK